MDKYFDDFDSQNYFPDLTNPENDPLIEGIAKSVLVNKYERSSIARQRCIEYRGNSCSVCGLNFESIYGELGKGFIHIHHLIPLHEIKTGYLVNYKEDLIPVCPNCHAMLHRKLNGKNIDIEQLKNIMNNAKKSKEA